jgi:hypothetical protein
VLEALCLFVGLPPRKSEDLDEEPFGETVAADDRVRVVLSALGQMHFFTAVEGDEALPFESMDHLGHRRRGEAEELRESSRNHVPAFIGERVDGLEILLDGGRSGNC